MDEITAGDEDNVTMAFLRREDFVAAEWKLVLRAVQDRKVCANRAEVAGAGECGHGKTSEYVLTGSLGVSTVNAGLPRYLGCAKRPHERHVGERHLARTVRCQGHAYMCAHELEVCAADDRHLDLIEGSL